MPAQEEEPILAQERTGNPAWWRGGEAPPEAESAEWELWQRQPLFPESDDPPAAQQADQGQQQQKGLVTGRGTGVEWGRGGRLGRALRRGGRAGDPKNPVAVLARWEGRAQRRRAGGGRRRRRGNAAAYRGRRRGRRRERRLRPPRMLRPGATHRPASCSSTKQPPCCYKPVMPLYKCCMLCLSSAKQVMAVRIMVPIQASCIVAQLQELKRNYKGTGGPAQQFRIKVRRMQGSLPASVLSG